MNDLSLSQLNAAVEKSINQTVLMEHFQVSLIGKKLMISIKIDGILLLILICLVISRKINRLASSVWIAQNKKRSSSNYYHQVPVKIVDSFPIIVFLSVQSTQLQFSPSKPSIALIIYSSTLTHQCQHL